MAEICAEPLIAVADLPVQITVEKLKPRQEVTLYSWLADEDDLPVHCFAHYIASDNGTVDLEKDHSVGGFYTGIEPMGLFWAMRRLSDGPIKNKKVVVTDVTRPQVVFISVHMKHLKEEDISRDAGLKEVRMERWFINDNVECIPVREGRVRGTMFIPKGIGPHSGIITIHGLDAGLYPAIASLLACNGFAAFALPFYKYQDLPSSLSKIGTLELEYFEEAINIFSRHERVSKRGIGLYGNSLGGTIAMAIASYIPGVVCSVNVGCVAYPYFIDYMYHGRVWPRIDFHNSKLKPTNGSLKFIDAWKMLKLDELDDSVLEIQNSNSSFLFIYGEEDAVINGKKSIQLIKDIFKLTNKLDYETLCYPGSGHVIEYPHMPVVSHSDSNLRSLPYYFGGKPRAIARAAVLSWSKIIDFFKENLTSTNSKL